MEGEEVMRLVETAPLVVIEALPIMILCDWSDWNEEFPPRGNRDEDENDLYDDILVSYDKW